MTPAAFPRGRRALTFLATAAVVLLAACRPEQQPLSSAEAAVPTAQPPLPPPSSPSSSPPSFPPASAPASAPASHPTR